MAYTEEEAKEKWCPFARNLSTGISVSFNRYINNKGVLYAPATEAPCIASGCMVWRWTRTPSEASAYEQACRLEGRPPFPPDTEAKGYCGLAGKE